MNKNTVKELNKVLDITGDLVKKERSKAPSVEINTQDLTSEYEFSQQQYHSLLDKGNDALEELLAVAKESENPRAFEVVTQLLNGLTNTTKELLLLQKTKKEIEKETKDPSTVIILYLLDQQQSCRSYYQLKRNNMSDQYLGNSLLKRADVQHNFTKEEIEEYIKCRDDILYFLENHVKIVHVDEGLIPFSLYPYQKKLITTISDNINVIVKTGRQVGKSTTTLGWLLHYVLFNQSKTVGILANKAATARELLGRIQIAYQHLPKFLQQGLKEWNKGSLELENGSKIIASSTSSSAIRGFSFSCILLDEFAHVQRHIADEFIRSVYTTI